MNSACRANNPPYEWPKRASLEKDNFGNRSLIAGRTALSMKSRHRSAPPYPGICACVGGVRSKLRRRASYSFPFNGYPIATTMPPPAKCDEAARRQAASVALRNSAFPSTMYLAFVSEYRFKFLAGTNMIGSCSFPVGGSWPCQCSGQETWIKCDSPCPLSR